MIRNLKDGGINFNIAYEKLQSEYKKKVVIPFTARRSGNSVLVRYSSLLLAHLRRKK